MIVHYVRFASPLSPDEVLQIFRERAPRFRSVQGLIQKHYGDDGEGHYCGIYLFDSQESLDAFRDSELAKSIPAAYQAEDLRIERYDVVGTLHAETPRLEQI
jgi:Putative mono-oxygenase ydhR